MTMLNSVKRTCLLLSSVTLLAFAAAAANLTIKDLPSAVQKTVQEQAKGADVKSISKESEHGATQYEVETIRNGKHHDFVVSPQGALMVVEDETSLEAVPPAAKAAILKKVGQGKLGMVETYQKGAETLYEAAYTSKSGKQHEVLVRVDGTEAHE